MFCFYSKNPPPSNADSQPSTLPAPPAETSAVGKPFELTLRSALEIALRSYPGIGAAQHGVLGSKAGIGVARASIIRHSPGRRPIPGRRETSALSRDSPSPFPSPPSPSTFIRPS
uniref:Uncharacterized protein n=1 Tax=Leptospirillum ferrodiazotrophum TaxID=412449 RepID=C6HZJ5_9BACT|nr:MAG: hypothetical protein UBAL3_95320054 [Leptospirillum ferrodiazotrophum]